MPPAPTRVSGVFALIPNTFRGPSIAGASENECHSGPDPEGHSCSRVIALREDEDCAKDLSERLQLEQSHCGGSLMSPGCGCKVDPLVLLFL